MKILVINGPNLNLLGIREPDLYGRQDYAYLTSLLKQKGTECKCETECFQSNHEGAIIDRIQEAYLDHTDALIINPGAYTHYSYAIRDALAILNIPKAEVHITDIHEREAFRAISVTAPVCDVQIVGKGLNGYIEAYDILLNKVLKKDEL